MKINVKCQYCGKEIVVDVPDDVNKTNPNLSGFSCNECVPENSAARDGINESIYIEAKN